MHYWPRASVHRLRSANHRLMPQDSQPTWEMCCLPLFAVSQEGAIFPRVTTQASHDLHRHRRHWLRKRCRHSRDPHRRSSTEHNRAQFRPVRSRLQIHTTHETEHVPMSRQADSDRDDGAQSHCHLEVARRRGAPRASLRRRRCAGNERIDLAVTPSFVPRESDPPVSPRTAHKAGHPSRSSRSFQMRMFGTAVRFGRMCLLKMDQDFAQFHASM